ncbi:hypothetical protein [Boudabousia marimammalium]|uniref:Ornithine cyclodeaminase family protein n=1 Tax=Boudabousia marimammalium TaxID=156892 RepID=A0A1Q5PK24_9ACTO|nr:hypothetical protein [Boudabousia marimammalium]OKL46238.1 hypothetical protein BM477_07350 [Boudabousia marimammalium]
MIILSAAEIEKTLTMESAIVACKDALGYHAKGEATVPLRVNVPVEAHQGQALFMPASVPAADSLGIKIVSVYPNNVAQGLPAVPAQVIMMNPRTGLVTAMLEGTSLTRIRTGAVQGAATDVLARPDANIGALIGTGGQASGQLEAMLTVRDLELVKVMDVDFARAQAFASAESTRLSRFGTRIQAVETSAEAVQDADIITAVTISKTAVFDAELIKPGAHVNGMGSYTPEMSEIPQALVRSAGLVAIDTADALAESGDLINPINAGQLSAEDCVPLGEIINGVRPGRQSEEEITFFECVGSAVLDVVCGQRVLEQAEAQGMGQNIQI